MANDVLHPMVLTLEPPCAPGMCDASAAPKTASLWSALAHAARLMGMSLPGLVARIALRSLTLASVLWRGRTPLVLRLKFLPLAALYRVLAARRGTEAAEAAVYPVLFAASMEMNPGLFRLSSERPGIDTITADYERAWRGFGRYQAVKVDQRTRACFDFAVTDCSFARCLAEMGLESVATAMCDADRIFWSRLLKASGVQFSKSEQTLACGGSCCRSIFTARQTI